MNEITKKPLVDILSEQLNKIIVMRGDDYVELGTDYVVSQENLDVAITEQSILYDKEVQDKLSSEAKQDKLEALATLYVTINGIDYDAHQEAINNMSSVVAAVQLRYEQAKLANNLLDEASMLSDEEVYNSVWKQTTYWKGYDNEVHEVQFESLVEAIEKAMTERGKIYGAL